MVFTLQETLNGVVTEAASIRWLVYRRFIYLLLVFTEMLLVLLLNFSNQQVSFDLVITANIFNVPKSFTLDFFVYLIFKFSLA